MKVFVSYSVSDQDLLQQVLSAIRAGGDEPLCWETNRTPGNPAWASIFQWIDASDLVIVIITDRTVGRAMSVGQEVGHARARGKLIVPLVTADVKPEDLGCLNGIIYQPISRTKTRDTLSAVQGIIADRKQKAAEAQKQLLLVGGIITLLCIFGGEG